MEEFRSEGVRYLFVDRGDFKEDDYLARQKLWGLTQLDDKDGARLYKVD